VKLKIVTWTPSRWASWQECPYRTKLQDLDKLCPVCFKGTVSGGFNGEPVVCSKCVLAQPSRPPLDRGNRLDDALTLHLSGPKTIEQASMHEAAFYEATQHPVILKLVKSLRKSKGVIPQASVVLNDKWEPVSMYTKGAWARMKLDVLKIVGRKAHVIDWKSGGIDKRTKEVRAQDKYDDQMFAYQLAALSAFPPVQEVTATLAFLDAGKQHDPLVVRAPMHRRDLDANRRKWELKIEGMMSDESFVPRPGYYCGWCSFSKPKGGPCKYG